MTHFTELPLIPLRGLTVFPTNTVHFDVARKKSIAAIEHAVETTDGYILLASQKSTEVLNPRPNQICTTGVIAKIKQIIKLPEEVQRVTVEAEKKVIIGKYTKLTPFYMAEFEPVKYTRYKTLTVEAYNRKIRDIVKELLKSMDNINPEIQQGLNAETDFKAYLYKVANLFIYNDQQSFLEENDIERAYMRIFDILVSEMQIARIERKLNNKVRMSIDKGQKEYYLREQMKVIQDELGENDDDNNYLDKIEKLPIASEYKDKLSKDYKRSNNMPSTAPEYSLTRNYLDFVFELPWNETTTDNNDLINAKAVLDEDHYGLDKIKERIIEFLAVRQLTDAKREPIICLVGPPGVGKTSIVKSIARALNRKYVRMSLGGVHDEAEIRGHRRTYIGAMAGRIISSIKQAGSNNPVFLMDEIDKLASDYRGDPASALLEVLDPEQNNSFRDNYLEIPFDLSNVIFITTANDPGSIPDALYDRMEIIEMSGYTPEEKLEIAKRHLIKKQLTANGISEDRLTVKEDAIMSIILNYTRESGVRNLEKSLAQIMRKVARKIVENPDNPHIDVGADNLAEYLGAVKYSLQKKGAQDEVGAVTGLAWTAVGGEILTIEASIMPGKGEILLTGHLGDVMKESARTAISFIHSHAKEYNISEEKFSDNNIHIHIPEGAIPKDGPSAGITIATAVLSALTEKGVKKDVAMTGEITLRGKILPIGGLKEKTLAAHRAGIKTVILPEDNRKDLEEIPDSVKKDVKLVFVKDMSTVFSMAIKG